MWVIFVCSTCSSFQFNGLVGVVKSFASNCTAIHCPHYELTIWTHDRQISHTSSNVFFIGVWVIPIWPFLCLVTEGYILKQRKVSRRWTVRSNTSTGMQCAFGKFCAVTYRLQVNGQIVWSKFIKFLFLYSSFTFITGTYVINKCEINLPYIKLNEWKA